MASNLKVDKIQNSAGVDLFHDGYPKRPGQIIETLTSICDGSTVIGLTGSYTWPSVTTQQGTSTTYTTITGSSIAYTPPSWATKVVYKFDFASYWIQAHAINHYKFFIDSSEVTYARHGRNGQYQESRYTFEWIINIGGVANTLTGRQATWTAPKTLSMQVRHYGGSNYSNIHGSRYWDGVDSSQFSMPSLSIIAIA